MIIKTKKTIELTQHFLEKILELLNISFSNNELRSKFSQKKAFTHKNYNVTYCTNQKHETIGFVLWWDFDELIFIEYLCVLSSWQNMNIGSSLLETLKSFHKIIIVEVLKSSTLNIFYQKNGFICNNYNYIPIALNEQNNVNDYYVFSYDRLLNKSEYDCFIETIHLKEYQF